MLSSARWMGGRTPNRSASPGSPATTRYGDASRTPLSGAASRHSTKTRSSVTHLCAHPVGHQVLIPSHYGASHLQRGALLPGRSEVRIADAHEQVEVPGGVRGAVGEGADQDGAVQPAAGVDLLKQRGQGSQLPKRAASLVGQAADQQASVVGQADAGTTADSSDLKATRWGASCRTSHTRVPASEPDGDPPRPPPANSQLRKPGPFDTTERLVGALP
jgi:hypothetical protein